MFCSIHVKSERFCNILSRFYSILRYSFPLWDSIAKSLENAMVTVIPTPLQPADFLLCNLPILEPECFLVHTDSITSNGIPRRLRHVPEVV